MNKVYSNYFSGSVLQISECLEIILYNSASFTELLSLYNLESFYLKNLVRTSDKYVRVYRDSAWTESETGELVPTPFEYKKYLEKGFDVIIYISNVSSKPIGYTEYVNIQGIGVSLEITVDINREYKGELEIILKNKLVGNNLNRKFQGKELYEYATIKDITTGKYRNLFTSDVGRTESDVYSFVVGTSGVMTKSGGWKLWVRKNITITEGMSDYNICFYKGDVVLSSWSGTSYKIYYLSRDQEPVTGDTGIGIKRIEGRYFYDTEGNLRDLETLEIVEKKNKTMFVDFLDKHCTVYDLPTFYTSSAIFKYIPEINNIYLDLDNYLKSSSVIIKSKIGSWFVLKRDYGGMSIYTAVSSTSSIILTEEDLERAIFVGEQTMILREDGDSTHEGYYSIYNTFGKELITERARVILLNGRLDWWNNQFRFCFLDTAEDDTHFEEYYGDNGLVPIVYDYEDLGNSALRKYRRNIYPSSYGIPKLIGSYGGLIFYKIGSNINYL